ncbi:MAG: imidazoleglycerol-phosphate dehydratase HisB [Firmicutes bacterium]|nr:imidazoleglycerol-phosphate dehydratase HisB [Bacillota bacterium]MDD4264409.1 imidazoleglycerol-phosphate dehydratase HisB [Bacillota bacterium]MDD4693194.1 imidazoleglycerol-phosphate dehydratase HisB [Bacillota bacterium]
MREAEFSRSSRETKIKVIINLDGTGQTDITTGIGFFDHLLTLFAFHGSFDLTIKAEGDLDVDDHHTVEDVAIVLGLAIKEALGEKVGINRYGFFLLPMDEALARVVCDISGRPTLVFDAQFTREQIGDMATENVKEFFKALINSVGLTTHIGILSGENNHHMAEAIFKAFGRSLSEAVKVVTEKVPSSKGLID